MCYVEAAGRRKDAEGRGKMHVGSHIGAADRCKAELGQFDKAVLEDLMQAAQWAAVSAGMLVIS